ncbi:MAG: cell envelope integrity protein TolA [Gammaproteobacteria bacterium]|nr:cell envelope integrity protein TolA [Gammaproteobacteria bacterium]
MKNAPRPVAARLKEASRGKSFYYSVLLHTALILVVVIGLDWKSEPVSAPASAPKVMNATAVDSKQIAAEAEKLKQKEQQKLLTEENRQRDAEAQVKKEQQRLEQLKLEQAEVMQKKEQENRRLDAEKQRLEKEREVIAIQKKKAEAENLKIEAEAKKALEAEKQRAAEAAKKQKAEEETKRLAEEQRKQDEAKAEAALKEALALEEAEQAAASQAGEDASELARYTARVQAAVSNAFVYPDLKVGLKCTLFVRVIPGGDVVEARVTESSGNPVFDRQAGNAVRKASPLPVPDEPRLFQQMREFNFVFAPEF